MCVCWEGGGGSRSACPTDTSQIHTTPLHVYGARSLHPPRGRGQGTKRRGAGLTEGLGGGVEGNEGFHGGGGGLPAELPLREQGPQVPGHRVEAAGAGHEAAALPGALAVVHLHPLHKLCRHCKPAVADLGGPKEYTKQTCSCMSRRRMFWRRRLQSILCLC